MTKSKQQGEAKGASSLTEKAATRPQVHSTRKNPMRLRGVEGHQCKKCGSGLKWGGGHGDDLGFQFVYCQTCDEFVVWDSFGMSAKRIRDAQDFIWWLRQQA